MNARILFLPALLLLSLPANAADIQTKTRCGWIENPTPGNIILRDRDNNWTIAEQGSDPIPGADRITDMSGDQYVDLGPHGYGCGCIEAAADEETMQIVRITGFKQKMLKECLADEDLPPPER